MNRQYVLSLKLFGWMALLSVALCSCIMDKASECPPDDPTCVLRFTYTSHARAVDRFAEEVEHLEVFFFDSAGDYIGNKTCRVDTLDNNSIVVDLPPAQYTVVAWGNTHSGRFSLPQPNTIARLEDLQLALEAEDRINDELPLLFHAMETFTVTGKNQVIPVGVVRNTKVVRVIFSGLNKEYTSLKDMNLGLTISGYNAVYEHDNIPTHDCYMVYHPIAEVATTGNHDIMFTLHTLRILEDNEMMLRVWDTRKPKTSVVDDELIPFLINGNEGSIGDLTEYLLTTHEFDVIGIELLEQNGGYVVVDIYLRNWDEISEDWSVISPPGHI